MDSSVQPNTFVALRLPSDALKVLEVKPNETISIGKYGTFQADDLIGQPFYQTYEILDRSDADPKTALRVVPATELYAPIKAAARADSGEPSAAAATPEDGVEYEVLNPEGQIVMRTNQHTVDDTTRQRLSMAEIEALKRVDVDGGRDVVAQILANHSAIDQKTEFSLAKYTLRKTKKFLKRFTVLPLDVPLLTNWMVNDKDPTRVMEMREEALALVCSWANVHAGGFERDAETGEVVDENRWLVVDGTGGLVVAAMAERMGILYPSAATSSDPDPEPPSRPNPLAPLTSALETQDAADRPSPPPPQAAIAPSAPSTSTPGAQDAADRPTTPPPQSAAAPPSPSTPRRIPKAILAQESHMSARTNTITLVHANAQPNLSLLNYFGYDPYSPSLTHPLHTHLHTLTWLQLLDPASDATYQEPAPASAETLASWKSTKRGNYYRKRRRWERIKGVVDAARQGGFKGLVVACPGIDASSVLRHALPLLRGGAQVVVYDPHVEPLAQLADRFSKARRSAYMAAEAAADDASKRAPSEETGGPSAEPACRAPRVPSAEFPVDPRLVLPPAIYTARARQWQVLPGRTHPKMTARGGAEGYVWVGTRVVPAEGRVEARGMDRRNKKRKTEPAVEKGPVSSAGAKQREMEEKKGEVARTIDDKSHEATSREQDEEHAEPPEAERPKLAQADAGDDAEDKKAKDGS